MGHRSCTGCSNLLFNTACGRKRPLPSLKMSARRIAVFAVVLSGVRVSAAQPNTALTVPDFSEGLPGATLRVQTDPSAVDCPPVRELANAVRAQLHVHAERNPKIRLTVSMARQDLDYLGHIEVEGPRTGERILRVSGTDCAGLKDALVVTLALILDEAAEPTTPQVPTAPARLPPPLLSRAPATPSERSFGVALGSALTVALPRDISAALRAELEFSSGAWGTALGAFWAPKKQIRFDPGTVDLHLWGAEGRLCRFFWHDGAETLVTGLCTEGIVAKLTGQGHGFNYDQPQARPWVALGFSASVSSRFELPVGWVLRAVATFPLERDAFGVDGIPGTAYRMPAVSFGLEALLRWRIL